MSPERFSSVISFLSELFPDFYFSEGSFSISRGVPSCTFKLQSFCGVTLIFNRDDHGNASNLWIDFSGTFFSEFYLSSALVILKKIYHYFGRVSRLDSAITFFSPSFSILDFNECIHSDKYSGFAKSHYHESRDSCSSPFSRTLNLGSRESPRYTRVYDTFYKHGYEGIRLETEHKRRFASHLFGVICDSASISEIEGILINATLNHLNFHLYAIKDTRKKIEGDLAPFWEEIKKQCIGDWSSPTIISEPPSIERTIQWIKRQVSKSLTLIRQCFSRSDYADFLTHLYEQGSQRISNRDKALIKEYLYTQNRDEKLLSSTASTPALSSCPLPLPPEHSDYIQCLITYPQYQEYLYSQYLEHNVKNFYEKPTPSSKTCPSRT